MIDPSTPRGRILLAALACAADRSWAQVSLLDIAEHAKVPLGEMRDLFASKSAIIAELMRTVDREVLQRVDRAQGQEKRDLLFDVPDDPVRCAEPVQGSTQIDGQIGRRRAVVGWAAAVLAALDAAGCRHR